MLQPRDLYPPQARRRGGPGLGACSGDPPTRPSRGLLAASPTKTVLRGFKPLIMLRHICHLSRWEARLVDKTVEN